MKFKTFGSEDFARMPFADETSGTGPRDSLTPWVVQVLTPSSLSVVLNRHPQILHTLAPRKILGRPWETAFGRQVLQNFTPALMRALDNHFGSSAHGLHIGGYALVCESKALNHHRAWRSSPWHSLVGNTIRSAWPRDAVIELEFFLSFHIYIYIYIHVYLYIYISNVDMDMNSFTLLSRSSLRYFYALLLRYFSWVSQAF